ncbi:MAG: hypothetical protein E7652_00675 [Ruminococcaceae bacterium]|nr:hypothetical protein [Oscillospiraceae bacterium]
MKRITRIIAFLLCILMIVPFNVFGYADGTVQNPAVTMPKSSPVIDGSIETSGKWSQPAYVNDATVGHFWATNPCTSSAEVFFAYDTNGLYFAADITDCNEKNSFVASTGYDNIDNDGNTRNYGFNGDVMNLMLDAQSAFGNSAKYTPWYNIGIYADGSVHVYRSRANEGDITTSCTTAGAITEKGWRFEVKIPWNIIVADLSAAGAKNVSATTLATQGTVSRASIMYMDRYEMANGQPNTWGRFITVCEKTSDGVSGTSTPGIYSNSYGIVLNHSGVPHIYGEWYTVTEPTCTTEGVAKRKCQDCIATETKSIPALGHNAGEPVLVEATCVSNGSLTTYCTRCNTVLSQEIYETGGHVMSDWYTVTEATDTENGLMRKDCGFCDYYEEKIIPALAVPYVYAEGGYDVFITLADNISAIRYVNGVYTTSSDIKNAPGCVTLNSSIIANSTVNGIFSREMTDGGVYTFWMKTKDGKEYISTIDISVMIPYITSDGVTVTVHNLYGVRDFFIAEGDYNTYTEINQNKIVRVTETKIAGAHDYSYIVTNPGRHSVCIRFNDTTRENIITQIDLTVVEPAFQNKGLQVHLSNLEDVKVIRTAYGEFATPGEIKRAAGQRSFSGKADLKGKSEYMIQYRENGTVTIGIQYNNGYVVMYKYDVAKKVPSFQQLKNTVVIGNLNDLQVIRYASGNYSTSAEIKAAADCVTIKNSEVVDGYVRVTLAPGTYTFVVQYTDESYNYYNVKVEEQYIDAIDIGDSRQLFIDNYMIDTSSSDAVYGFGSLVKKEAVFTFNKDYESYNTVYHNISQLPDGSYRMYYKATSNSGYTRRICYIESDDGINWSRPNLYTNTSQGGASNIVTDEVCRPDNLFVFYDTNPDCPENERWKGVYGQWGDGLFLELSREGDGNYFAFGSYERKMMSTPTETEGCYFDTLNTMYWDENRGKYVAFVRGFHEGSNYNLDKDYVANNPTKISRDIRYSESDDCINWSIPVPISYSDNIDYQMYTNCITPYFRSEDLYVGLPTKFTLDPVSTEALLMCSRDLVNWKRYGNAFISPNLPEVYGHGDCYPAVGMIQTGENELSLYMAEHSSSKDCSVLYRYTMRLDGFRAVLGTAQGSTMVTKPFTFEGNSLAINCATADAMRVTLSDFSGNAITSDWFAADSADYNVIFKDGNVADFQGVPVTLTFELKNSSIYSFKFNK